MTEIILPAGMHASDALLHKLFSFEGKVGYDAEADTWTAYEDCAGVPTIYYGLTKGVKLGMHITTAEAKRMLDREIATYENAIGADVKVTLSQCEYDALFDFTYNCGVGALGKVVDHAKLNSGNYGAVPGQIGQYTHYRDKHTGKMVFSRGLNTRRLWEITQWNHIDAPIEPHPDEAMPQAPQRAPAAPAVASAVASSWTIRGAVLGAVGAAGQAFEKATGIASGMATDISAEVDKASPLRDLAGKFLAHTDWILLGCIGVGLVIVVARRLSAAAQGREG